MQGLFGLVDPIDLHLDLAVIEKDSAAGLHLAGELVVGDRRDGLGAGHVAGGQSEGITLGHGDRAIGKAAEADLGPLQVLQDADVNTQFMGHLTDGGGALGVLLVVSVGEVESEGGGTGQNQLPNAVW